MAYVFRGTGGGDRMGCIELPVQIAVEIPCQSIGEGNSILEGFLMHALSDLIFSAIYGEHTNLRYSISREALRLYHSFFSLSLTSNGFGR